MYHGRNFWMQHVKKAISPFRGYPEIPVPLHITQCAFSPIYSLCFENFEGLTIFMGKLSMLRAGSMPVVVGMQQSSVMRCSGYQQTRNAGKTSEEFLTHDINSCQKKRRIRSLSLPSFRDGTSCGVSGWSRRKASNVAWRMVVPDSTCSESPTFQQNSDKHKTRCLQRTVVLLQAFAVIRPDLETGLQQKHIPTSQDKSFMNIIFHDFKCIKINSVQMS